MLPGRGDLMRRLYGKNMMIWNVASWSSYSRYLGPLLLRLQPVFFCSCLYVCVCSYSRWYTVCNDMCLCVWRRGYPMTRPVFSDPVLSCFPETQWGDFNNSICQAFESLALCGILPARQRPTNRSRPLPLCHSVPQGLWGLKLCWTRCQR